MFFDQTFINNLRSRVSIADVVSTFVRLRPKGKGEFTGLCPFHQEKTPSFTVSDAKGFYHCFGCGVHGDVIKFVMEQRGLSYPEAIKDLAAQAGLALPKFSKESVQQQKRIDDSYEVMELAAKWFESNLHQTNAIEARRYLKERGLTEETIKKFRIGFAPDNRDSLNSYLKNEGVVQNLILANGLVGEAEGTRQIYDRFRGRIIFPIFDSGGKVIAFGGRILDNTKEVAKYLNSSETDLFKKSYVLYGYNFARDKAYKKEQIIIVEGYMDVIAMHQAGFDNTVAPLGTAVTEFHMQHLWKICKDPVFCLDGDNAGLRASKKTAENYIAILEPGYSMKFAFLKEQKDPDEVIKVKGVKAMENIINSATNLADFIWEQSLRDANPTTPEKKAEFAENLFEIAKSIKNTTVGRFYQEDFKKRVNDFMYANKKKGSNIIAFPKMNLPPTQVKTSINQDVIESIKEKIIVFSTLYPKIFIDSQKEEFLGNLSSKNKNLENICSLVIEFLSYSSPEGVNYKGFENYLIEKGHDSQLNYLQNTSLKEEFRHCTTEQDINLAWGYLLSEFYLILAEREMDIFFSENKNDDNKFINLQSQINALRKERDYNRRVFEESTSNEI